MDAGINNVIYMELYSGPKMANGRRGKTIDTGTIHRGSTVFMYVHEELTFAAYFLFLFHVHCYLIQVPLCVCHPISILMILMFMMAKQVPINHKQRHHRSLLITNNGITGPY